MFEFVKVMYTKQCYSLFLDTAYLRYRYTVEALILSFAAETVDNAKSRFELKAGLRLVFADCTQ